MIQLFRCEKHLRGDTWKLEDIIIIIYFYV